MNLVETIMNSPIVRVQLELEAEVRYKEQLIGEQLRHIVDQGNQLQRLIESIEHSPINRMAQRFQEDVRRMEMLYEDSIQHFVARYDRMQRFAESIHDSQIAQMSRRLEDDVRRLEKLWEAPSLGIHNEQNRIQHLIESLEKSPVLNTIERMEEETQRWETLLRAPVKQAKEQASHIHSLIEQVEYSNWINRQWEDEFRRTQELVATPTKCILEFAGDLRRSWNPDRFYDGIIEYVYSTESDELLGEEVVQHAPVDVRNDYVSPSVAIERVNAGLGEIITILERRELAQASTLRNSRIALVVSIMSFALSLSNEIRILIHSSELSERIYIDGHSEIPLELQDRPLMLDEADDQSIVLRRDFTNNEH